jgi:hypothetical protein
MKFGILVTDNGTHSPEKWASAVADKIVSVAQTLEGEKLIAAQKLQLAVAEALVAHHDAHQKEIIADLATGTHFEKEIKHDPGSRADEAVADIQAAAKGTPWEHHFLNPETVAQIRFFIGQSLVDLAHVERLYYGDKNPGDEKAAAYKLNPTGILTIPASEILSA